MKSYLQYINEAYSKQNNLNLKFVKAVEDKDFKRADEIRDYLNKHGIVLEDTEKNVSKK